MNTWQTKKLGDIATVNPPKMEVKSLNLSTPVSFVSMASISAESGTITQLETRKLEEVKNGYTYFTENNVLLAKITPCMENGKIAITEGLQNGIGFGTTEVYAIRPTSQVLPGWIYAYLKRETFRKQAEKHMTGSAGQKRVPKRYLENVDIPIPPLNVQQQIVEKLDAIRKLQELNNHQISKTNELHKSLINEEIKSNKYSMAKLSEITKPQEFTNPEKTPNDDYQYVDISAIDSENFAVDLNRIRQFKGKDAPSRARKKIETGDVLFSTVRPNLRRIAKVDFPTYNSLASTGFAVLRPDISKINPDYMGTVTCSGVVTEQVLPQMKGAAYPAVSDNDVLNAEIPLPDRSKQDELADRFLAIQRYKRNLIEQRDKLSELFESTLSKLMRPN